MSDMIIVERNESCTGYIFFGAITIYFGENSFGHGRNNVYL